MGPDSRSHVDVVSKFIKIPLSSFAVKKSLAPSLKTSLSTYPLFTYKAFCKLPSQA